METVIFDLDGTLADTSGDLIAAANACFQALGHGDMLDPVADSLTAFHGGRAMLKLGFSRLGAEFGDADVMREYPKLLSHYEDRIDVHTSLYPGCEAALTRLADSGYILGVCTNKPEHLAETLLRRLGVRHKFASLIGANTTSHTKPNALPYMESVKRAGGDPAKSVLIGDTETDLKTARASDVPVVLVEFGPEGQSISRLSPDALLPHYDDIDPLVERLIAR